MSRYFLAPTTYAHFFQDGAVLLDARSNRYVGLSAAQAAALKIALGHCPPHACTPQVTEDDVAAFARALADRHLITTSAELGKPLVPPDLEPPRESLMDWVANEQPSRIRPIHVWRFVSALARATRWVRRGDLEEALHSLQRAKRANGNRKGPDTPETYRLVSIFKRLRIFFYPSKDRCLLDSLVLALFMLAFRARPTFVIGVTHLPFTPHSWVQHEACVLNCSLFGAQRPHAILVC